MVQRIDKYLWFARFYKSRTLAATAVSEGRVRINGNRCEKPSMDVKLGDMLTFNAGGRVRVAKVLAIGTRRGPAVEAATLYQDLTPALPPKEEIPAPAMLRDKGLGRPTKKDRRAISALQKRDLDD